MKRASIYDTTHEIGERIAFIWRCKNHREMEPDAIEAMLHEITVVLKGFESRVRRNCFRAIQRPHRN